MTENETKNKYSAFITEISEILGLGKPVDILKLCATTDLFFQPLEKHIAELKKENAELKNQVTAIRNAKDKYDMSKDKSIIKAFGAEYTLFCDLERILEDWQEDDKLTKAKEILNEFMRISKASDEDFEHDYSELIGEAERFIKDSEVEK